MSVVNERRIRSVYDAIDGSNYKKALQEADKVLKKDPDLQIAKILKAIAFLKLDKAHEAEAIIQELELNPPTDDASLEAFFIYFKETKSRNRFTKIMEHVVVQRPNDEIAHVSLFKCYVREFNLAGQLKVVRQLIKMNSSDKNYFYFSIMTSIMQGYQNPILAQKMFYPLAKKMLLNAKRSLSFQECRALLLLYDFEGDFVQKLACIDDFVKSNSSKEKLVDEREYLQTLKEALKKESNLEFIERFDKTLKLHIVKYPDDIFHWKLLIDFCFRADDFNEYVSIDQDKFVSRINDLYDMIISYQEKIRGVEQAKFFYQYRLEQAKLNKESLFDRNKVSGFTLGNLLNDYFTNFGTRPCCALDLCECLQPWFNLVNSNDILALRDAIRDQVENVDIKTANDCYKIINYECICQYIGCYDQSLLPPQDRLLIINRLCQQYHKALPFGEPVLTKYNPGDYFICLVVNHLSQLASSSKYLFNALCLLEAGITASPSNHNICLLLVRLYALFGAYPSLRNHFRVLDVKQLLLESLSYPLLDVTYRCGQFSQAFAQYHLVSTQLQQHLFELEESMVVAYKEKNGPAIVEFTDFQSRLKSSFSFESAKWYKISINLLIVYHDFQQLFDYITENQLVDKLSPLDFDLSNLIDGRDFSAIPLFIRHKVTNRQQQSFKEELLYLKLRRFTCASLARCIRLTMDNGLIVDQILSSNGSATSATLETIGFNEVQQLINVLQDFKSESKDSLTLALNDMETLLDPLPSLAHVYIKQSNSFLDILLSGCGLLLDFRRAIINGKEENLSLKMEESLLTPLCSQVENIKLLMVKTPLFSANDTSAAAAGGGCISPCLELFSLFTMLVESIAWSVTVSSMLHSAFKPLKLATATNQKKSTKKRANQLPTGGAAAVVVPEYLQSMTRQWQLWGQKMTTFLKDVVLPLLMTSSSTPRDSSISFVGDVTMDILACEFDDKMKLKTIGGDDVDAGVDGNKQTNGVEIIANATIVEKVLNNIDNGQKDNLNNLQQIVNAKLLTIQYLINDVPCGGGGGGGGGIGSSGKPPQQQPPYLMSTEVECGLFRR